MADQKLVEMLKRSVGEFNAFKKAGQRGKFGHLGISYDEIDVLNVDLSDADLSGERLCNSDLSFANLSGADLSGADLSGADLSNANLSGADLRSAILINAKLRHADLRNARPNQASFHRADLHYADLRGADLSGADFGDSDLNHADLSGSDLSFANLTAADLSGTKLSGSDLSETIFGLTHFNPTACDTHSLKSVIHESSSSVSHAALLSFDLPEEFLRGCGVAEELITQLPAVRGSMRPISFYSCFVSYSHSDKTLAQRLHNDLQNTGIRVWLDEKSTKVGDRIVREIDQAIRSHERVILLCSKNSLQSEWVKKEMKRAFAKETREKGDVILPLKLDKALDTWDHEYAVDIQERLYADFTGWSRSSKKYDAAFERLVAALNAGTSLDQKESRQSAARNY